MLLITSDLWEGTPYAGIERSVTIIFFASIRRTHAEIRSEKTCLKLRYVQQQQQQKTSN